MPKPSILVVDDDQAVRDAVAEDLKRENYDLLFAGNGMEGLSMVRDFPPTVIILDLRMPVMSGLDFLDQIQLKPSDPYSVIVLTAYGDDDSLRACYDGGATTFLKKPFNLYEIRGVVKNVVAVKQLTIQLDELVTERTVDLEQRMREVGALNRMFQVQISQHSEAMPEFQRALAEFQRVLAEIGELAQWAQSLPIPELPELPSLGPADDQARSTG